ncbi:MAG: hypothetical protein ACI4AQ_01510 [Lachnospiraceae bacterium]
MRFEKWDNLEKQEKKLVDKEQAERVSAWIAGMINEALYVDYTPEDVRHFIDGIPPHELEKLKCRGILRDQECYYVMRRFCDALKLQEKADEDYLQKLFLNAKKFTAGEFYQNEYLKNIRVPEKKKGPFLLTNVSYDRGEFFQYAMSDVRSDGIVPYIGFCTEKVQFPSIYEGDMPWVSVCPSETSSMQDGIDKAHGRCLVLGMGLAYYPYMISLKKNVKSITIVERQPEIIELFNEYLLPQFQEKDKIKVVCRDAFEFMEEVEDGDYDFCYADIWENQYDGADAYTKISTHERRMPFTQFEYWIEDAIRWECRQRELDDSI